MASEASRRGPGPGTLAEYAARAGELRVSAANRPVDLNDPEVAWLVVRGALDAAHLVVHKENLAAAGEFAGDRLGDHRAPLLHDEGLDGQAGDRVSPVPGGRV